MDQIEKTLKDVLPHEFHGGEYHDTRAWKYRDVKVVIGHDSGWNWPGNHKNIVSWYELENGVAVGWNENVSRGWSFPVHTLKKKNNG